MMLVLFLKKKRCSHFGKHLGTCWLNGAAFTVGMKFNDSVFKCIIYTLIQSKHVLALKLLL